MAEDQDKSQKTEEPTEKRLEDARKKGQVASSRDLNSFFLLSMGAVLLTPAGALFMQKVALNLVPLLEQPHRFATDRMALVELFGQLAYDVGLICLLPLAGFVLVALAAGLAQSGFLFTGEALKPKAERISPLSGFKRLFSAKSFVEFLKSTVKLVIVSSAAILAVAPVVTEIVNTPRLSVVAGVGAMGDWIMLSGGTALVLVALIALADFAYQRHAHRQQLMMSRQDVKDEHKQTEGDPHVKNRLRQLRSERSRQRMMAEVPKATVVVTNPTHIAVALRYEPDETAAPEVVAKGADHLALRIRELAREHDIAIVENRPLARSLHKLVVIGMQIPAEFYEAVAEVIGFVMRRNRK